MQSILYDFEFMRVQQQLKLEKHLFARAFHRGKSLSQLKKQLNQISKLERKYKALSIVQYN
ncbi:hypothetical protein I5907_01655 [Panacibacter sp. DH6]|uniref:Uncharacterized protein n=1 Tax=Panacibacter microcysteis TaxID=2793269 RepID=A0A931GX28_9BACT|nr:hypothetical protein [Panacibacter microcysteis]MBG9374924.1 hypothetical protein [Panacibacter microcysteis]